MKIAQGRNKLTGVCVAVFLATVISGCHSLQPGSPHPFTTLFEPDDIAYRPAPNAHDQPSPDLSPIAVAELQPRDERVRM